MSIPNRVPNYPSKTRIAKNIGGLLLGGAIIAGFVAITIYTGGFTLPLLLIPGNYIALVSLLTLVLGGGTSLLLSSIGLYRCHQESKETEAYIRKKSVHKLDRKLLEQSKEIWEKELELQTINDDVCQEISTKVIEALKGAKAVSFPSRWNIFSKKGETASNCAEAIEEALKELLAETFPSKNKFNASNFSKINQEEFVIYLAREIVNSLSLDHSRGIEDLNDLKQVIKNKTNPYLEDPAAIPESRKSAASLSDEPLIQEKNHEICKNIAEIALSKAKENETIHLASDWNIFSTKCASFYYDDTKELLERYSSKMPQKFPTVDQAQFAQDIVNFWQAGIEQKQKETQRYKDIAKRTTEILKEHTKIRFASNKNFFLHTQESRCIEAIEKGLKAARKQSFNGRSIHQRAVQAAFSKHTSHSEIKQNHFATDAMEGIDIEEFATYLAIKINSDLLFDQQQRMENFDSIKHSVSSEATDYLKDPKKVAAHFKKVEFIDKQVRIHKEYTETCHAIAEITIQKLQENQKIKIASKWNIFSNNTAANFKKYLQQSLTTFLKKPDATENADLDFKRINKEDLAFSLASTIEETKLSIQKEIQTPLAKPVIFAKHSVRKPFLSYALADETKGPQDRNTLCKEIAELVIESLKDNGRIKFAANWKLFSDKRPSHYKKHIQAALDVLLPTSKKESIPSSKVTMQELANKIAFSIEESDDTYIVERQEREKLSYTNHTPAIIRIAVKKVLERELPQSKTSQQSEPESPSSEVSPDLRTIREVPYDYGSKQEKNPLLSPSKKANKSHKEAKDSGSEDSDTEKKYTNHIKKRASISLDASPQDLRARQVKRSGSEVFL